MLKIFYPFLVMFIGLYIKIKIHAPTMIVPPNRSPGSLKPQSTGLCSSAQNPLVVPISLRVKVKCFVMAHSNLHHLAPTTLLIYSEIIKPCLRAFALAVPSAQTVLPSDTESYKAHSLTSFKTLFKCHFLTQALPHLTQALIFSWLKLHRPHLSLCVCGRRGKRGGGWWD